MARVPTLEELQGNAEFTVQKTESGFVASQKPKNFIKYKDKNSLDKSQYVPQRWEYDSSGNLVSGSRRKTLTQFQRGSKLRQKVVDIEEYNVQDGQVVRKVYELIPTAGSKGAEKRKFMESEVLTAQGFERTQAVNNLTPTQKRNREFQKFQKDAKVAGVDTSRGFYEALDEQQRHSVRIRAQLAREDRLDEPSFISRSDIFTEEQIVSRPEIFSESARQRFKIKGDNETITVIDPNLGRQVTSGLGVDLSGPEGFVGRPRFALNMQKNAPKIKTNFVGTDLRPSIDGSTDPVLLKSMKPIIDFGSGAQAVAVKNQKFEDSIFEVKSYLSQQKRIKGRLTYKEKLINVYASTARLSSGAAATSYALLRDPVGSIKPLVYDLPMQALSTLPGGPKPNTNFTDAVKRQYRRDPIKFSADLVSTGVGIKLFGKGVGLAKQAPAATKSAIFNHKIKVWEKGLPKISYDKQVGLQVFGKTKFSEGGSSIVVGKGRAIYVEQGIPVKGIRTGIVTNTVQKQLIPKKLDAYLGDIGSTGPLAISKPASMGRIFTGETLKSRVFKSSIDPLSTSSKSQLRLGFGKLTESGKFVSNMRKSSQTSLTQFGISQPIGKNLWDPFSKSKSIPIQANLKLSNKALTRSTFPRLNKKGQAAYGTTIQMPKSSFGSGISDTLKFRMPSRGSTPLLSSGGKALSRSKGRFLPATIISTSLGQSNKLLLNPISATFNQPRARTYSPTAQRPTSVLKIAQTQINLPRTSIVTRQSSRSRRSSRSRTPFINLPSIGPGLPGTPRLPPTTSSPPPFVKLDDFKFREQKRKKKSAKTFGRSFSYSPSLRAILFNIRGAAPKSLTGVELRPMRI